MLPCAWLPGDVFTLWRARCMEDVTLDRWARSTGCKQPAGASSRRHLTCLLPPQPPRSHASVCCPIPCSLALLRMLRPIPGADAAHALILWMEAGLIFAATSHPTPHVSPEPFATCPADLLVLGCGRRAQRLPPMLARQLHEMGVRVDAMDTVRRQVAAWRECIHAEMQVDDWSPMLCHAGQRGGHLQRFEPGEPKGEGPRFPFEWGYAVEDR